MVAEAVISVRMTVAVVAETVAARGAMCKPWTLSSLVMTCLRTLRCANLTRIDERQEAAEEQIGTTTVAAGVTTVGGGTMTADTTTVVAGVTTVEEGTMIADTTTVAAGVTTVEEGMMIADTTTVAARATTVDTATEVVDVMTVATAVAQAGQSTTGATINHVQGTMLRTMTTSPQHSMLQHRHRHHQMTPRSTQLSMRLALTQPSAIVTRVSTRSGPQRPLKLLHPLHSPQIQCLIYLPRLLLHRSSRRNKNHHQPTSLMHLVPHQHRTQRQPQPPRHRLRQMTFSARAPRSQRQHLQLHKTCLHRCLQARDCRLRKFRRA